MLRSLLRNARAVLGATFSEQEFVDELRARRQAEQEAIVFRGMLKANGYTDEGLDRHVREHLVRLQIEARAI